MPPKAPFQLLELNVMSGQDLAPVVARMKTYAVAWVLPDNRLTTKVDSDGRNNPTWNDKFTFRVNEDFLRDDSSVVIIEIYACHWFRDILVGTIRVPVANVIPPPAKPRQKNQQFGMRFVALQVRRPSGRPQGILNIGIAVIDSSRRSMPLDTQLSSSPVGHPDLIGKDDSKQRSNDQQNEPKPTLRRSKSDRSDLERTPQLEKEKSSSIIGSGIGVGSKSSRKLKHSASKKKGSRSKSKAGSVISGSSVARKKHGKASGSSMLSGSEILIKGKHARKQSSTMTGSEVVDPTPKAGNIPIGGKSFMDGSDMDTPRTIGTPKESVPNKVQVTKIPGLEFGAFKKGQLPSTKSFSMFNGYELRGSILNGGNGSILSISDVGPSPSEVAAAVAAQGRYYYYADETSSAGWSLDESEEGLKSKLERWRTELPPAYDRDELSNPPSSLEGQHARRKTDGGSGLFSCFGNVFGYECSCSCGLPNETDAKSGNNGTSKQSPSSFDPLKRG